MTYKANQFLESVESKHERVEEYLRPASEWLHEHEGELFGREEGAEALAEDLEISEEDANIVIGELVSDAVDPIVQVVHDGERVVGIIEFEEFNGAYGYVNYDDVYGEGKRVVCQQCVNESKTDKEVSHATENDPSGSFPGEATYDQLLSAIHEHYKEAHDVVPEEVETGATLASGTTIGGNTAWHKGNDGAGSNLDADTLDGTQASTLATPKVDSNGNAYIKNSVTFGPSHQTIGAKATDSGHTTVSNNSSYTYTEVAHNFQDTWTGDVKAFADIQQINTKRANVEAAIYIDGSYADQAWTSTDGTETVTVQGTTITSELEMQVVVEQYGSGTPEVSFDATVRNTGTSGSTQLATTSPNTTYAPAWIDVDTPGAFTNANLSVNGSPVNRDWLVNPAGPTDNMQATVSWNNLQGTQTGGQINVKEGSFVE